LSWDVVLEEYVDSRSQEQQAIIHHIHAAYAGAEGLLRPTPGIAVTAFRHVIDIGPICSPGTSEARRLREVLQCPEDDCVVLVGFGGIAQQQLAFTALEHMVPFRFLVDAPVPAGLTRVFSVQDLKWPFATLLASVDLIVTKPGYGTIVEAVALKTPVVYVRRYRFADEASLVEYLHRYGQGAELSAEDFHAGRWLDALLAAKAAPCPSHPSPALTGGREAADYLMAYLS
jgi:hypothetical protein